MNSDKLLAIGRDRDSFKALIGRKIRERRKDERQLAEHRRQSISSKRETHALPMQEVIALLDDCPCPPQHYSIVKH